MASSAYVELQACTNFSFLRGASHPEELFARAARLQYPALGITDHGTVAGIVRAHAAALSHGVRLLPGARVELCDGSVLLAYPVDRAGWGQLCRLLTLGHRRGERGRLDLTWSDLTGERVSRLLLLLSSDAPYAVLQERLDALTRIRDHCAGIWLTLSRHWRAGDAERLNTLERMAHAAKVATVVTGDVLYHAADRSVLQDLLTAIRHNVSMDALGALREPWRDRYLRGPTEMASLYRGHEAALAHSGEIASLCRFSLSELRYQYPSETDVEGEDSQDTLVRLVREALPSRYPAGAPDDVRRQLTHELRLVAQLGYAPYFLTVNTIVRYARAIGILCQGRGSAANSAICYVLGITAIDPVRSGLLFERFISVERREPPDIDVDFDSDRREEVIQWIYRRYGRQRAALCATVMRYQPKGAVRDVGKALGLPDDVLGLLSKHLASALDDQGKLEARAGEVGLDLRDRRLSLTLYLARQILGFPRQLGTHPGGFVLTHDRLDELVPIQPAAMEDRQIIVWDKDDIDELRFMKVDVLGLGMLGCLQRAFDLLVRHGRRAYDMATIPPEDEQTYAMIARADTLGTFQIESRAQMAMLPRTRPRTFYDLVIQVAIVRPGPIQGDMVHPYLRRREGLERPDCPSPALRRILGKTLGVPLFQEQAMQVAIHCAGFTPSEADQLRRGMKMRDHTASIADFREKMVRGMVANGYTQEFAERTFRQLEGFGSYGFPESHAASFALIAYASSWLKCHHPDVFCAALLNSQPMGFYAPAQIVRDAREHGVEVRPICVNQSRWDCTLEGRSGSGRLAVRLGLRLVKGLANADAARLIANRMPLYESIEDVWRRADVPTIALERLAEADAFASLNCDRRMALWQIKGLADEPLPLFAAADRGRNRPAPEVIEPSVILRPMTEGSDVVEDYLATGLTLRAHPLAFLREGLTERGIIPCEDLATLRDGTRVVIAGLVLMRQRPGTAKGVMFVTIEDETGVANLILWKDRIEAQRAIVMGASLMIVHGTLQREGEVMHVVVRSLEDGTELLREIGENDRRPVEVRARNFQ
ncbi:error-prone DNA polymerase [Acetobacter sp. UBA5411]|uniref:error-prone DNA polymerase n=1 Tax=Acetobacter sp. UBA5411 TaxID=1945905 RepID=UPI0025C2FC9D|nr:error-prone DNA polymerase [Acetobacter sp. UBA5411]